MEGTRKLLHSDVREPVNIGSDELLSIDGLVSLIEEIAGVEVERTYDTTKPRGVMGRCSDNTKIEAELGWSPTTPLAEGLAETYRWIEEQVRPDLTGEQEGANVFAVSEG